MECYIIIVNYNGYIDTISCVNSLNKILKTKFKIIIVDNCSTDNSVEQLHEKLDGIHNLVIIECNDNMGFSGGNNIGIKYALEHNAEYIVLLNNDTEVQSDFLDELIKAYHRNPDAGIITGRIMFYSDKQLIWFAGGDFNSLLAKTVPYGYNQRVSDEFLIEKELNFSTGCLMFIPRKVFEKVGNLAEHYFLYSEDTEYSLRVIENGYKIIYAPNSVIYHKVSSSTSKTPDIMQYYMIRNNLLVIHERIYGIKKLSAYMFTLMKNINGIIKRRYKFRIVIRAYSDIFKKKYGKFI